MTIRRPLHVGLALVSWLIAAASLGCDPASSPPAESDPSPTADPGPEPEPAEYPRCNPIPDCDDTIHVDPESAALFITDPEVLAKVPLKRVMEQLVATSQVSYGPEEALQRLFDTMNQSEYGKFTDTPHCDDAGVLADAASRGDFLTCPRTEGKLAFSEGLLDDGGPDSFLPVAIVNRFDLTPINAGRCGQYRIIYAKRSGLTDPKDRVFLIFEPALQNPAGCLEACRPIAKDWHALQGASTAEIGAFVEALFFEGVRGFAPVIHPSSFGPPREEEEGGGYGGGFEDEDEGGQIRVSMHMGDEPWNMRELRFTESPLTGERTFLPMPVRNNPPVSQVTPQAFSEGTTLMPAVLLDFSLPTLTGKDVSALQIFVPLSMNAVESPIEGPKKIDYHAAATQKGSTYIEEMIDDTLSRRGFDADCPPGDPLDARALLNRATALSCAGCHSPSTLIGPERSLGCGLTWPDSIGQVHVTEKREISPALKEVFLPHRAKVLETYLQACDLDAMFGNFQSGQPQNGFKKVQGGTLGGGSTH